MSDSFDPMDPVDPPDSFVHGILQESKNSWSGLGSPRILEWVAILFSRVSSQPRDQTQVSGIAGRLFTI